MTRTLSRRTAPKRAARHRRWVFIGVGGALVLVLALAVILSPDQPVTAAEYQTVTVSGQPLPPFVGDPQNDPAVGLASPELSGSNFQGSPIAFPQDGRPKVILFLAHWCPHCQNEVQAIGRFLQTADFPAGVDFYSVATASSPTRPNWPSSAWLDREGWPLPVLVDDEQMTAFQAFGMGAFPFYVFVDASGTIALRLSGEQDPGLLAELMRNLAETS